MNQLKIIEHQNQRVLLTRQLAESYETDSKSISYNFNHNRDKYLEGKHYFLLQGDELKAFREFHDLPNNLNKVYLWTERGALLHAKSLNTDKAWEVYDNLVEYYFKVKSMSPMQMLKLQNAALLEVDEKVEVIDSRVTNLENTTTIISGQQYTLQRLAKTTAVRILGGKESQAYMELHNKVFGQLWRDYKEYFKIPSYKDTLKVDFEKAKEYLQGWRPDHNLEIEISYMNEVN